MTTITVMRDDDGKLTGFTEDDKRAYGKFKASIEALEIGELFRLSTWFPRNPKLHKLHFAVLKAVYDSQEQFNDADDLRKWSYVGAGFADFYPGPTGKTVAIPRSVRYDRIDDADFSALHKKVVAFLRTTHATRFLWPHMDDAKAGEGMDNILSGFGQ